uniref:Uncharacterized protein n=1 Tax=Myoviridae sp. ctgXL3 TaxID=2826681 RepID=A0A8S5QS43_9CAUD|nr:MAG TPA: hypothetical protein [Myoviridae sp. ctgXL3]
MIYCVQAKKLAYTVPIEEYPQFKGHGVAD